MYSTPSKSKSTSPATESKKEAESEEMNNPGRVAARTAVILAVFLSSRLLFVLITALMARIEEEPIAYNLKSLLLGYDSGWYMSVASEGYGMPSATQADAFNNNFFPLYPSLVRFAHRATGIELGLSGLLISNLSFLVALFLIHRYIRIVYQCEQTAHRTVLLVGFWPHSFVYSAAYTEGLFLLLLSGGLLALENRRYFTTGLLLALLSALRPNGIIAAAFPFFHMIQHYRLGIFSACFRNPAILLPCALAPLGLFAYWWFSYLEFGDAFAQSSTASAGWNVHLDPTLSSFLDHLKSTHSRPVLRSTGLLIILGLNLLVLKRGRLGDFLALSVFCLPFTLASHAGSFLRYTMVLFPMIGALAWSSRRNELTWSLTLVSVTALNTFLMIAWFLGYNIAT